MLHLFNGYFIRMRSFKGYNYFVIQNKANNKQKDTSMRRFLDDDAQKLAKKMLGYGVTTISEIAELTGLYPQIVEKASQFTLISGKRKFVFTHTTNIFFDRAYPTHLESCCVLTPSFLIEHHVR